MDGTTTTGDKMLQTTKQSRGAAVPLCIEASIHLASANQTLGQGSEAVEAAIASIDAALSCLKRVGNGI